MSFTDEIKKIGENISASYDARIGTLEDIFKDTQSTLKDARATVKNFHGERMHMSEELHSDLEHFRKDLMDMTSKLISGFAKQHKEMAETLKGDLNKFHQEIYNETHKMLREYRNALEKISADFHSAHNAWVSFSGAMSRKKRGEKCKMGEVSENAPRASGSTRKHKKTKRSKG